MVVNDYWGRGVQRWILFVAGLAIIAAMLGKWLREGTPPDPIFGGMAMVMMGLGQELARRLGGG